RPAGLLHPQLYRASGIRATEIFSYLHILTKVYYNSNALMVSIRATRARRRPMTEFQTKCPACHGTRLVDLTPPLPGFTGWGQRCKECGWHEDLAVPDDGWVDLADAAALPADEQ